MPTQTTRKAELDFHRGEVLLRLSDVYPTLSKSILEMIQNALDALAQHVYVKIDLKQRTALVMDDGEGITPEKFEQALRSIGRSVKSPRKDKRLRQLGRFGLGLISPLRKVKQYTVTSFPASINSPVQWTFNAQQIAPQHESPTIPTRNLSRFVPEPVNWAAQATWRTIVRMEGITTDKMISLIDLDNFEVELLTNFGQAMRMHGTICLVEFIDGQGNHTLREIRPKDYSGMPLKKVSYKGSDAGVVGIELYRTRSHNGLRRGIVSVRQQDDLFLVPWQDFVRQARGQGWADTSLAFEALSSGFFEGVITAQNIELAPTRNKFMFNDPLVDLYAIIDQWYREHGHTYLHDEKEKARSERLQQLGLKSLERWRHLLDEPQYAGLREALLNTFVFGRLGEGHVMPEPKKPDGFQDKPSIRTGQGGAGIPREPRENPEPESAPHEPHRPGDLPMSSVGPKGGIRQLVKHDSLGLQLAHEPLDSSRLWELDASLGILFFNTTHPVWEECEKKDYRVLHLQDWIILQVLHLLTMPEDRFEEYRVLVDQQAKGYVELFVISSPPKRL